MSAARAREDFKGAPNLPDREILLDLFERMVLLRRFESIAQIACRKGETPGFLHLYIGEEATGVGVCAHLRPTDWVTSTHRGHGHALAKGANPGRVMAELFGKVDGICGGRGGTMHLYDRLTQPQAKATSTALLQLSSLELHISTKQLLLIFF